MADVAVVESLEGHPDLVIAADVAAAVEMVAVSGGTEEVRVLECVCKGRHEVRLHSFGRN